MAQVLLFRLAHCFSIRGEGSINASSVVMLARRIVGICVGRRDAIDRLLPRSISVHRITCCVSVGHAVPGSATRTRRHESNVLARLFWRALPIDCTPALAIEVCKLSKRHGQSPRR